MKKERMPYQEKRLCDVPTKETEGLRRSLPVSNFY